MITKCYQMHEITIITSASVLPVITKSTFCITYMLNMGRNKEHNDNYKHGIDNLQATKLLQFGSVSTETKKNWDDLMLLDSARR